jgi:quercetin dioxygenase-like cupin family protein
MKTVNLNELELNEFVGKENTKQHCKATFPMLGAHGTKKSATVYFELAPGDHLGRHTDSAEELLLILEGDVEVSVGDETGPARSGTIALVPEMVPHDIRNTGKTKARVIGFFGGANNIVATFDQTWLPTDSRTVDTEQAF